MVAMIFGPGTGDGPHNRIGPYSRSGQITGSRIGQIKLTPSHSAHFVPALPGEHQKPDNASVIIIPACTPNGAKFFVGEDAISGLPRRRPIGAQHGISDDLIALGDGPVEQSAERCTSMHGSGG